MEDPKFGRLKAENLIDDCIVRKLEKDGCLQMTLVHPILLNSHARETRQGFIVFARCWSICATPFKRRLLAGRRKIKPPST